jgi:hypothetical protein
MSTVTDQLMEKGEIRGEAKAILLVLKTRLGKVPKSTSDAVHAITTSKTLEKLTKLAAKCESLEEFEQKLNK